MKKSKKILLKLYVEISFYPEVYHIGSEQISSLLNEIKEINKVVTCSKLADGYIKYSDVIKEVQSISNEFDHESRGSFSYDRSLFGTELGNLTVSITIIAGERS